MLDCFPGICKALSSIPSSTKNKEIPQACIWTSNASFLPHLTSGHLHSTLCFLFWLSGCLVEVTSHSMTSCVSNLLLSDESNYIPFSIVCICCILFSHLSMQIWIVSLSCSKPYGNLILWEISKVFSTAAAPFYIPTENAQGFLLDSPWRQVATCLQSKSAQTAPAAVTKCSVMTTDWYQTMEGLEAREPGEARTKQYCKQLKDQGMHAVWIETWRPGHWLQPSI